MDATLSAPLGTLWVDGMMLEFGIFGLSGFVDIDIGCTLLLGFEFVHVTGLRVGPVRNLRDGWIGRVLMSRAKEIRRMEMKFSSVAWRKGRRCFEERIVE